MNKITSVLLAGIGGAILIQTVGWLTWAAVVMMVGGTSLFLADALAANK